MQKKLSLLTIAGVLAVLGFVCVESKAQLGPIKDGFYKIRSELDDGYLTATQDKGKGPGKKLSFVSTAEYQKLSTQEWKVKTNIHNGSPLQLIRNELIRDNEVSKAVNENKKANENDFVAVDWNLIHNDDVEGDFEVSNGLDCLESQGKGKRVSITAECDQSLAGQQWRFEFLYDIPPVHSNTEQ